MKTKRPHNVLSRFMILCWAAFIAILATGSLQAAGWTPLQVEGIFRTIFPLRSRPHLSHFTLGGDYLFFF